MTDKARGIDIAGDNQVLARMAYPDWAALGFCFGFAQVRRGDRNIPDSHAHRAAMRSAGYLTAPYSAVYTKPVETMKVLIGERDAEDTLPSMLDAEFGGLTEPILRAAVDYYHAQTDVPLLLYTGWPWWAGHIPDNARPHYGRDALIIAGYPFDSPPTMGADGKLHDIQPMDPVSVALRATPPVDRHPTIPPPWGSYWSWQHSGHGTLPGYSGFLDLHVSAFTEAELRARYAPDSTRPSLPEPVPAIAEAVALIDKTRALADKTRVALEGLL